MIGGAPSWSRRNAASGRFSSDRTISQYAEEIWAAKPLEISMAGKNPIEIV